MRQVKWAWLIGLAGDRKQPLFVITTILGISAIFKSYPSIGDMALYISLLSLYRHVFPRRYSNPPYVHSPS